MNSGHLVLALRYLRRLAGAREKAALTDRHLLERYVHRREEAAFATLVQRHGGMVWGVCRRVFADLQDADDAFQATFLVLIHKAASLRQRESLAGFLQSVAWRLARRVKTDAARRRIKEGRAETERTADPVQEAERHDLRALLDAELDRLPKKYRAPLILCYLEGLTYTEAARRLGWREGTVCGRLARGRELLRRRLSRHVLTLSGAALLAALAEPTAAPAACRLHVRAATREDLLEVIAYHAALARLMGEFRKTSLALQGIRGSAGKQAGHLEQRTSERRLPTVAGVSAGAALTAKASAPTELGSNHEIESCAKTGTCA